MGHSILRTFCLILCMVASASLGWAETRKETALSYVELGDRFTDDGNFDLAIGAYSIAVQFEPNLALAYFNRAFAQQARGNLAEAIADYGRTLEIVPECAEAYANRA